MWNATLTSCIWEEMHFRSSRLQFLQIQDGVHPHTTEDVLTFHCLKFKGCVVSRRSEVVWPLYLLNLNVLDYFCGLYAMIRLRRCKPVTIKELKAVVEDVTGTVPVDVIRNRYVDTHQFRKNRTNISSAYSRWVKNDVC